MEKSLLGTTIVTQIGIVVRDIEQVSRDYASFLGVDVPPIGITDEYETSKAAYLGNPTHAQAKQAFFEVGPNVQIELLEPVGTPSAWADYLAEKGEGVHHIAFHVKDMEKSILGCQEKGFSLIQSGNWATGSYSYMNTSSKLKVITELLAFHSEVPDTIS